MEDTPFVSLDALSQKLGLSIAWLKEETDAGRIPLLIINGRRYYHLATVEQSLVARLQMVTAPVDSLPTLSLPIKHCDLSTRAKKCLSHAKIETIGELVKWTPSELRKIRSLGNTSLRELVRFLSQLNLSLATTPRYTAEQIFERQLQPVS